MALRPAIGFGELQREEIVCLIGVGVPGRFLEQVPGRPAPVVEAIRIGGDGCTEVGNTGWADSKRLVVPSQCIFTPAVVGKAEQVSSDWSESTTQKLIEVEICAGYDLVVRDTAQIELEVADPASLGMGKFITGGDPRRRSMRRIRFAGISKCVINRCKLVSRPL